MKSITSKKIEDVLEFINVNNFSIESFEDWKRFYSSSESEGTEENYLIYLEEFLKDYTEEHESEIAELEFSACLTCKFSLDEGNFPCKQYCLHGICDRKNNVVLSDEEEADFLNSLGIE